MSAPRLFHQTIFPRHPQQHPNHEGIFPIHQRVDRVPMHEYGEWQGDSVQDRRLRRTVQLAPLLTDGLILV